MKFDGGLTGSLTRDVGADGSQKVVSAVDDEPMQQISP